MGSSVTAGSLIGRMTTSGTVTFPPVGSGLTGHVTAGPDGDVWFTSYGSDTIDRITPPWKCRHAPSRLSPSTAAEDEGLTPSIFSRARAAVALIPSKKYLVRRWGSSDRNFLMRTLRTA